MAINKLLLRLALLLALALVAACTPQPADALPLNGVSLTTSVDSCVTEDYTGTKLIWCQKICETTMDEAIAGSGATPITGVDGRITSHVAALNDGSGNLLAIYDHNADGVHPSNEGRFIMAQAWRTQLEADGLV